MTPQTWQHMPRPKRSRHKALIIRLLVAAAVLILAVTACQPGATYAAYVVGCGKC